MRRNETIELAPDQFVCRFGDVTLNAPIIRGSVHFAVNERPRAIIQVDLSGLEQKDVDLSSTVTLNQVLDTCERRIFTGAVKRVHHSESHTEIHAEMAQEMVGVSSSVVARKNCERELLYSIFATFGVANRSSSDLSLPTSEASFDVICPLDGIIVTTAAYFDGVEFAPVGSTLDRLKAIMNLPEGFDQWLAEFSVIARTTVHTVRMHDAQEEGVRRIDEVLGKLVALSRYSLLTGPDGQPWAWTRQHKFFNPRRALVAAVIDETDTAAWIQRLELAPYDCSLDVNSPPFVNFQNGAGELDRLGARQAMVFLARAAQRLSPIDRVIFLWQAIEFFLGDYKVPKLFDSSAKSKMRTARNELAKSLTKDQIERLNEAIGNLNNPSLRMKLDHYAVSNDIPISEAEYELLWDLRAYRNGIIHGRIADPPKQEVIDHGIAVAARLFFWPARPEGGEEQNSGAGANET